jgi:hypothetical protein
MVENAPITLRRILLQKIAHEAVLFQPISNIPRPKRASRGSFSSLFLATLGILKGNGNASKRVCVRAIEPGEINSCLLCRIPHLTEATT